MRNQQEAGWLVQRTGGVAESAGSCDSSFAAAYESDPGELLRLRRDLRAWLSPLGYRSVDVADVVLATSEAVANAIEHGVSPDGLGVTVEGTIEDRAICVVVRDNGRWRKPVLSPDRGRGLALMRELMHDVGIECHEHGTVVRLQLAALPVDPAD